MGFLDIFSKKNPPPPPIIRPTILVVDDEQYLRDFYKELLSGEGYDVLTAVNGEEALAVALTKMPKLMLLDLMMPVMDGHQVLAKLREKEETKEIPVIVFTNAGSIDNMSNAQNFAIKGFLIKSNVSPEEILSAVKTIVPPPPKENPQTS